VETAAEGTAEKLTEDGLLPDEIEQARLDDALVMASASAAWAVIDALIARGADINGRDRWGQTAMHFAATTSVEAVQALLDRGADAAKRDWQFQSTPVGWSHHFEHHDERDLLLAQAELELVDCALFGKFDKFDARIATDAASVDGAPYATERWVGNVMRKHHAGRNHPVREGVRLGDPIRACAQYEDTDGVRALLERGARADFSEIRTGTFEFSWLGRSALGWAIAGDNREMADLLRASGATVSLADAAVLGDLTAVSLDGDLGDALFLTVLRGHLDCARTLLDAGADANRVAPFDQQMRTPLCVGVGHGVQMATLLLDAGADPSTLALFGRTATTYASDDEAVLALLRDRSR